MSNRHLFIIDPLASLNVALDSSLRVMAELTRRGHLVDICEPRHLSWQSPTGGPKALCQAMTFGKGVEEFQAAPAAVRPLADFAAIHMRKDPPYDLDYIATTWLLDGAPRTTRVYNHPEALRRHNEKLAILRFPEDTRPALVSSEPEAILSFIETACQGDAVLKPLTLFGGRGVIRLRLETGAAGRQQALAQLMEETEGGRHLRLVQPFDPAIFAGEVRVFTAFGEPLAWCLKRPAEGQFLANTRAGATLHPYTPSAEEDARVRRIAQALQADGVAFIGFDVIGGYISEINLTSPRLLEAPSVEATSRAYVRLVDLVVKDLG